MIDPKTVEAILADLQEITEETSRAYRQATLNDEEVLSAFGLSPEDLADADLPSKSQQTAMLGGTIRELNSVSSEFRRSVSKRGASIEDYLTTQKEALERRQQLVNEGYKDAAMMGTMAAHLQLIAIFSKYV